MLIRCERNTISQTIFGLLNYTLSELIQIFEITILIQFFEWEANLPRRNQ